MYKSLAKIKLISAVFCIYLCVSVCPLAYLKNHMSKLHEIFRSPGHSISSFHWQQCNTLLYFRFSGWRHVFTLWAKCKYRLCACDIGNYSSWLARCMTPLNCTLGGEVCYRRLPCLMEWWPYDIRNICRLCLSEESETRIRPIFVIICYIIFQLYTVAMFI